MAKASGEAAEAKEIEAKAIDCAKEAGALACEDSAVQLALAEVEAFILGDVDKIAQEAGGQKGKEIFGDFGEEIGKERKHLSFFSGDLCAVYCRFLVIIIIPVLAM